MLSNKVIVSTESMTAIADKLREKTQIAERWRAQDMPAVLGTLHGYISEASGVDITPAAIVESVSDASEYAFVSTSAKLTTFPHSEPTTVFAINELTFAASAARTE